MSAQMIAKPVNITEVREGMIVAETVFTQDGQLLIEAGHILDKRIIGHLLRWGIREIRVSSHRDKKRIFQREEPIREYDPEIMKKRKKLVSQTHSHALSLTMEILNNLRGKKKLSVNVGVIRKLVTRLVDEAMSDPGIFMAVTNIKKYDDYLFSHSLNVCVLSILTGVSMGLLRHELLELAEGALLHDTGMSVIPREIVYAPRMLSEDEFFHIKKHPILGADILEASGINSSRILNTVYQHHERLDGSGYPQGLAGEQISLFARIVMVADVYDAMNSDRKHRLRYLSYDVVGHLLKNAYRKMDRDVIASFVRFASLYPVGSYVKLNTGEIGIVLTSNPESPIRPVVKVLRDRQGFTLVSQKIVNLYQDKERYISQPLPSNAINLGIFEAY